MSQVRVKSEFSFLNGLPSVDEYVEKAHSLGQKTVFLTDTSLHGAFQFLKAAKSKGMVGVLGMEFKVKDATDDTTGQHDFNNVVIYAKNYEGYKELIDLVWKSHNGKTDKGLFGPYLNRGDLSGHSKNLSCMVPYESGFLTKQILNKNSAYKNYMTYYKDLFGDDLYIEEQPHKKHLEENIKNKITQEDFNTLHKYMGSIAKTFDVKILPSNLVLYVDSADKEDYDVFAGIGQGAKISDENRISYAKEDHSYKSDEEMAKIFGPKMDNIKDFENKFSAFTIPKINVFPSVKLDEYAKEKHLEYVNTYGHMDEQEFYLRLKTFKGLFERFEQTLNDSDLIKLISKRPDKKIDLANTKYSIEEIKAIANTNGPRRQAMIDTLDSNMKKLVEQMDYELLVVDGMGFNGYLLIVEDYVGYAKKNGIPVGPGRGSAAGALRAYALGITDVDPVKHKLLFERFLNPGRYGAGNPDIDVDFDPHLRHKVIEYVSEQYGSQNVAGVSTYGTMAAKQAIKDVGKFYGENFQSMNRFAKQLPGKPGIKISEMLEQSKFLKDAYESNVKTKKIVDVAMKLEKTKRQAGVHACAIMVAPEPLSNFTALSVDEEGKTITQLDAHDLEDLGLLKMDFLGLENLSIIDETLKTVKKLDLEVKEVKKDGVIDMLKIDYDDPKTFTEVFASGDTTGVFQFESKGMRGNLQELVPDKFDDIAAIVALFRPGPMAYIPSYIKRKHGKEKIEYDHEVLEETMKDTYGIAVYQEQLIQMSQVYAGYSASEADILRRAVGKKKRDIIEQQKSVFIEKAAALGRDPAQAKKIFENVVEPAADYSFNKSHAVCYAMVAMQTAYLKTHYGVPFYQALLNSKLEDSKVQEGIGEVITELREKGFSVENPNINTSGEKFEAKFNEDKTQGYISYGLSGIKSLPDKSLKAILAERELNGPFKDFSDFVNRLPANILSKGTVESLIGSGALDDFGDRTEMLEIMPDIIAFKTKEAKKNEAQQGLPMMASLTNMQWILPEVEETHVIDKIGMEKKYLGYYVQTNPIKTMNKYFKTYGMDMDSVIKKLEVNSKIEKNEDKKEIAIVGYVEDKFDYVNKKGVKTVIVKCTGHDYDFEITIDHAMIQEDQILPGNVLMVKEKYLRKHPTKNKFMLKNPFNFETTTFRVFEERVNAALKDKNEEVNEKVGSVKRKTYLKTNF